jgi:hypothetical protein
VGGMLELSNKFNTEKVRSMFLCTVLGFVGMHEFYQKKYAKGVLFLLFCGLGMFGSFYHIMELTVCLPIVLIASFISQIRLIVDKKNTDIEFCLGVLFFLLQIMFISFKPTFYSEQRTITTKNGNSEKVENYSVKI